MEISCDVYQQLYLPQRKELVNLKTDEKIIQITRSKTKQIESYRTIVNSLTYAVGVFGVGGEEKENGQKKIFENIMVNNFSKLFENFKPQIQVAQHLPSRMKKNKVTSGKIIVKNVES